MLSFTLLDNQPWKGEGGGEEGSVNFLRGLRGNRRRRVVKMKRWWRRLKGEEKILKLMLTIP